MQSHNLKMSIKEDITKFTSSFDRTMSITLCIKIHIGDKFTFDKHPYSLSSIKFYYLINVSLKLNTISYKINIEILIHLIHWFIN